jgi:hypothetical protein
MIINYMDTLMLAKVKNIYSQDWPCLTAIKSVSVTRWVEFGLCFQSAWVTAMIGFRQTKTSNQFTKSWKSKVYH